MTRLGLTKRVLLLPAFLLGACAPTIHVAGGAPIGATNPSPGTFVLREEGPAGTPKAGTIVAAKLEDKGFERAREGIYRVDVALSTSDPGIALAGTRADKPISLCKLRRHALSIAFVERASGMVLFRRSADVRSCGDLSADLVKRLAVAALG